MEPASATTQSTVVCLYCEKPGAKVIFRGLCTACYSRPKIRAMFPLEPGAIDPKKRNPPVYRPNRVEECIRIHLSRSEELPLPDEATDAIPGSDAKVAILEERARKGEALFHPSDRRKRKNED